MSDPSRNKPYPELVEQARPVGTWQIQDADIARLQTRGAVDPVNRWMVVPLESAGRPISRHELAHVRFSPQRFPRVRFDVRVLAVVEDARINLALTASGLRVAMDREGRAHVCMLAAQDAKRGDVFALLARTVASLGTNVEDALQDQLGELGRSGAFVAECTERVRDALERARVRGGGEVASFEQGLRIARLLARELRAARVLDYRGRAHTDFAEAEACCYVHTDDGDPERPGLAFADAQHPRRRAGSGPGRMEIRRVPLTVRLRVGHGGGRGWRAATEGGVVRYLHRWVPDRAIFRRRRRRAGSGRSVLIDASGSMSLRPDDLDALLRATPAGGQVAMYSGRRDRGELRIIARGSRRAATEHLVPYGSGNIVDVPALVWLSRQPMPRIWVSDGGVTGIGDRGDALVSRRVEAICRSASIRRVASLQEAVAWLSGETGAPRAAGRGGGVTGSPGAPRSEGARDRGAP